MMCALLALVIANPPWNGAYQSLLHQPLRVGGAQMELELTVHEWINDGLMSLFFFLVGLEIKREMLVGELASLRNAALVLWTVVLLSGIHATIAGVLLAMVIPARANSEIEESLLSKLERALHLPVSFLIVPLFALANAGLRVNGESASGISTTVASGVIVGLVVGTPLGITVASWLAVRARIAALPDDVTWRLLQSVSWLGGIGLTMSLFVGALAFADPALLDSAKIGVLTASLIAAFAGWFCCEGVLSSGKSELPLRA